MSQCCDHSQLFRNSFLLGTPDRIRKIRLEPSALRIGVNTVPEYKNKWTP